MRKMSEPGLRRADLALLVSQIQVAVAVLSVAVGLLALATGLGAAGLDYYVIFGSVVGLGGVVLLATAYRPLRLTWWQWLVVGAAGVGGTAASLLISRESGCCLFVFHVRSGYPFDFTGWSIGLDSVVSPAEAHLAARQRPADVRHGFDPVPMVVDGVFWAYAGLLVLLPVRQLVRLGRRRGSARSVA
jgi:hypothetical protein